MFVRIVVGLMMSCLISTFSKRIGEILSCDFHAVSPLLGVCENDELYACPVISFTVEVVAHGKLETCGCLIHHDHHLLPADPPAGCCDHGCKLGVD